MRNDITKGIFRRQRPLVIYRIKKQWNQIVDEHPDAINYGVMNYAKSMADISGQPLNTILKGNAVKRYRDALWFGEGSLKKR